MNEIKKSSLSRRGFIKISAIAGGILLGGSTIRKLIQLGRVAVVKETRILMGTIINLAVIAEDESSGHAAIEATFLEMERHISIFDHRIPDSPVANLNKIGFIDNPPIELVEVLQKAFEISERTNGGFDVTIKPLLDLYKKAQPYLPDETEVQNRLALVDFNSMQISDQKVQFLQSGMSITLDGIAKGYVVDAGIEYLKLLGFEDVLVEAGGDLRTLGTKDGESWKVGIQSPRAEKENALGRIAVQDQAIATSGDYQQYFSEDLLHHHIIDPRVGYSSPELASVTITSDNAISSDALATAVMVLGVDAGLELIERSDGIEGILITKEMDLFLSSGMETI